MGVRCWAVPAERSNHVRSVARVVLGGALIHDAFGLDSDSARRNRLFFQPVLVAWAWWSTDAFALLRPNASTAPLADE